MSNTIKHKLIAKVVHKEVSVTLVTEIGEKETLEEFRKLTVLPFLPRVGDTLAVGPETDYMDVENVFWCPDEGIAVWLEPFTRGTQTDVSKLAALLDRDGWLPWDEFKKAHLSKAT